MKETVLKELLDEKIVAIIRGVSSEKLPKLFDALNKGGIKFAEITFDATCKTPALETAAQIKSLKKEFGDRIHVGAGTVLEISQAELAWKAGAEYLISPSVDADIIKYCNEHDMVSIPGAMTPTEIVAAYKAGADLVKVFPSDTLGYPYIKAITAPLKHIPMIAVGGVGLDNITDYLKLAKGVGIGSNIINKQMVANDDWNGITELAEKYVAAVKGNA